MRKLLKSTALVLAALAAISGTAQAAKNKAMKDMSFTATAVGDLPTLTFKYNNGQWKAGKGTPQQTVKLHAKAKKRFTYRIVNLQIYNNTDTSNLIKIYKSNKFSVKVLDKILMHKVKAEELEPFLTQGKSICAQEGHPDKKFKKVIKPGIRYFTTITAEWNGSFPWFSLESHVPVQIVCEPQNFKVQNIKLSVKYEKQPGKCKMKAVLKAEFQTNSTVSKKIDFFLFRKDGNSQKNSVNIGPSGKGVFIKNYNFSNPVDRQYIVTYKNTASKWTPMKVKCSSSSSAGFKNQTSGHNN